MKVKVCDALCGSGKTSACINMMREETDKRFVFVTQYLSEVDRIVKACENRDFKSPAHGDKENKAKLTNLHTLMAEGENIATTHSLFTLATDETKELVKKMGYVLVLDEVVDVITESKITLGDMDLLKRSETVHSDEKSGVCCWDNDEYIRSGGGRFDDEVRLAKSKSMVEYGGAYFLWVFPPEMFTSFSDVYVLTYMFNAHPFKCFFEIHDIEYEYIGTKLMDGEYNFCPMDEMDRRRELRDKVHIIEGKVNDIGKKRTSLSYTWYKSALKSEDMSELTKLKKNISNAFRNVCKAPASKVMWTTFKDYIEILKGKGYMNAFIAFNMRASNEYRDRKYLAYCVNIFPRPWEFNYYKERGTELNGDMYAVSSLIQWLFRSAVRDGEEVWIYIPSVRMRYLLRAWMDNLAEGKDLNEITYKTPRKSRAVPGAKRGRPRKED